MEGYIADDEDSEVTSEGVDANGKDFKILLI